MAQDGCQPMERFAFAKNGSAQKSWAFCPSSRAPEYNGGAHPPGGVRGGTYEQRPYSVSGYVNGYNPSLPAYPPTRAQLEAQAKAARQPGPTGGRSGEISEMMSRQVEYERARAAGKPSHMRPPPGQDFSKLSESYNGGMSYSGHGAWDGPAPRGDPSKPAPGTPYYVKTPPEPVHDPSKEERTVPLGVGVDMGRLPTLGVDSAHAAKGLKLGYRHVRCGSASGDKNLIVAGAAIASCVASGIARESIFVSAKIAPGEMADPESACDAVLKELGVDKLDLLSVEWPVGGADAVRECWSKMEALVDAGKTVALGLCNASVPMVESVCATCRIKPVVNEVEAHPLMAHRKLVGVCRRYGVVPVANAPLGMRPSNGSTAVESESESSPLTTHPKMAEAMAVTGEGKPPGQTPEQILARWSVQRGVPLVVDAGAGDAVVEAVSRCHDFRLLNAQKAAVDAMEPPPRVGGTRFVSPPPGVDFAFDDPFLGGVARPGLELEKAGLL